MRIFGYLGIGFLIIWLFAPAPIAMADTTPVVAPDATQSPQPTPGEQDLLNLLPQSSSASRLTAALRIIGAQTLLNSSGSMGGQVA